MMIRNPVAFVVVLFSLIGVSSPTCAEMDAQTIKESISPEGASGTTPKV
jgi:hypothetical protein